MQVNTDGEERWSGRLISCVAVACFMLSILCALALAELPVKNSAQAVVSMVLISILMLQLFLLKRIRLGQTVRDLFRVTNILLAIYLIFRYLIWRVEFTIGGYGWASDLFGVLLFLAEVYAATYAILGFFVSCAPRERQPASLPDDVTLWPTVDILVPSYNEAADILEITLLGALNIDYPVDRFTVHLLDDGGTDDRCANPKTAMTSRARRAELQALCASVGAQYHTRVHNNHAKAGNINAVLLSLSGDLLVIVDADHVPTKDFLRNTVGFFLKDDRCAVVQTPHSFINPDPVEKNLDIFRDSPPETELFQQYIQQGMDGWGSSFFVGSAAIIRRSMLLEVGGIQTDTLTEDVETAMALHARGYHSVFLNRSQVLGLQPETVTSLISQRVRWAQGAIQILQMKNPLWVGGLSWAQKLTYITSFSYWLFPYVRLINMLAPSMFLVFGIMVYNATIHQYLIYGAPYFLATWIYSDFVYGKVRWPLTSDVYEMVQTPLAAIMLFSTFLRPGKRPFNVTPKGEHLDRDFVSSAAKIQLLFFVVILSSLLVGCWRWFAHPGERPQLTFTMLWEVLNFVIISATMVVMLERKQVRESYRIPAASDVHAELECRNGQIIRGPILDISISGLGFPQLAIPHTLKQLAEQVVAVRIVDREGKSAGCIPAIVAVAGPERVGLRFQYTSVAQKRVIVDQVYGDSQRLDAYLENRRRRVGFLWAYSYFLGKTFSGLWYWLIYLLRVSHDQILLWQLRWSSRRGVSALQGRSFRRPRIAR